MKPTDEQQSAFEEFLENYRTAEERKKSMDKAAVSLKSSIDDREWEDVVEISLELIASAGYLSFADSLHLER